MPDTPERHASVSTVISNGLSKLHRDHYGRGPTSVRTIHGHDHVVISAATQVTRSISKPGMYSGVFPFEDNASWEKNAATLRQLHALRARVRELEKKKTP